MNIFIVEIEGYDPDTEATVVWRAGTAAYINAATGDIYEPRVAQAPRFSRSVRSSLVGGRSDLSYGELILNNADRALDGMRADYFDGRTCTIKHGDSSASYTSFSTVLVARIQAIGHEGTMISVRLRDRSNELEKVFAPAVYGGTNALPLGVDGTADDIQGQSLPYPLGLVAHMPLIAVNTSTLIYEVSQKQIDYVINVFDAGAYLGRGADYTSQSDMEANQPASGTFRCWYGSSGTYIRLGATAYGAVTATIADKWVHTQISAAGLLYRILTAIGWAAGTDYVSADLVTLDQQCAGPLGILVQPEETISSLIDRVCATAGAWWGFDALDRFRVARLNAPTLGGTALSDIVLQNPEGQANEDEIPWRITLPSDWNYAVQQKSALAGIVQANNARTAWYESESRDQIARDELLKSKRLTATEQKHSGYSAAISQAQAEATRRLGLLSVRRDVVTATLHDYLTSYSSLDLGSVVAVQSDEIGYSTARPMVVLGIDVDLEADTAGLTLWG